MDDRCIRKIMQECGCGDDDNEIEIKFERDFERCQRDHAKQDAEIAEIRSKFKRSSWKDYRTRERIVGSAEMGSHKELSERLQIKDDNGRYSEGMLEQVRWRNDQEKKEQMSRISVTRMEEKDTADYKRYREACDTCRVAL